MAKYYLGMDIGGTKCAVLLAKVNHGIHILDKIRFDTLVEKGFDYTWEQLCASAERIVQRNSLRIEEVHAIGVSCGGPLDSRCGVVLSPPNLTGWDHIPLAEMLMKRFQIPAFIQNDANACALVEWRLGAGRGTDNMLFLTMGTGMGAGIIAEGRLLRGHTDMGGEVGHIRLTEDGPIGFGKIGSFEGHTSGGGIGRQAKALTKRLMSDGRTPAWIRDGIPLERVDSRLMADYARCGDADAKTFFESIGRMLGRGLAVLVDVLNPERIVIGSIFSRCEELLRPSMEAELQREAIGHSLMGLTIVPAQTGEALGDMASIMAALYALDIDPRQAGDETDARVLSHFRRLFLRYPALDGLKEDLMSAYLMLRDCFANGGKVLVCGNGGSCADGEHIVGELMKGFYLKRPYEGSQRQALTAMDAILPGASAMMQRGLPALTATGHPALSTAVRNDVDASLDMAQQVAGLGCAGDVVIGISTSGGARNVALAITAGKALGMQTLALTGGTGGLLKTLADRAIVAPANTPADVQELHLPIYHTLCAMLEAKFFEQ